MNEKDLYELKEISNSLYGYLANVSSASKCLTVQENMFKGITRLADRLEKVVNNLNIDNQNNNTDPSLFHFNVLFIGKDLQLPFNPMYNIDYLPVDQLSDLKKILENNKYQIVLIKQNSLISQINLSNIDTKNICFLSVHNDQNNIIKHQIFTKYLALTDFKYGFEELLDKSWLTFTQNYFSEKLKSGQSLSLRVMSVEDDLDSRRSLAELFELYDFTVTNCSTADDAFSLMTSESYDIIVLDIGLEDLDGYQLALRIRQIQKMNQNILCPILVNSGRVNSKKDAYKAYGITEYYQKPFLTKNLKEVLSRYIDLGS